MFNTMFRFREQYQVAIDVIHVFPKAVPDMIHC